MTVGETLTEARRQAGLSVDELGERTKIRATVIRSIEQDDYQACGGDLYVRGYVRAIAGAIGIDAQPLIRQYDEQRRASGGERANRPGSDSQSPAGPPVAAAPTAFDLPVVPETARPAGAVSARLEATRSDLPVVSAGPAPTSYDLPRVSEVTQAAGSPAVQPPAAAVPPAAEFPGAVLPTAEFPAVLPPVTPSPAAKHPAPPPPPVPPVVLAPTAEFPAAPPAVVPPAAAPAAAVPAGPVPSPGTAQTRFDLAPVPEDLMAAGYDLAPAQPAAPGSATAIIPGLGRGPAGPAGPGETAGRPAPGARRGLLVVAAIIVLIGAGVLGVHLATGGGSAKNAAATAPGHTASSAAGGAAAQVNSSGAATTSPTARASSPGGDQSRGHGAANAAAGPVTTLPVASASAYGPDGVADGDNPGNAKNAIDRDRSQPWTSQWYVSPDFGMLKHGTGLLLDLGKTVTVTSIRLDLPQYQGADLQIRAGNGTASADLRVVARASGVDGAVKLTLRKPSAARYLLIWFTRLPPDGAGHYQASVAQVVVTGRRSLR